MNVTMFMSKCLWVPLTGVSSWNRIGDGKWSSIHIALIFNFFLSKKSIMAKRWPTFYCENILVHALRPARCSVKYPSLVSRSSLHTAPLSCQQMAPPRRCRLEISAIRPVLLDQDTRII